MSTSILILGESGTGKSTAIRTLDPKETFIINVINKPLPFKGWKKYNTCVSDNTDQICRWLEIINKKKPDIKNIIIDDFQYIMANEYMHKSNIAGFQKYMDIGKHAWDVLNKAKDLRDDLNVFFLSHSETIDGKSKIKTIGKLLDEKITIEGMFTIVLFTVLENNSYYFTTQNNGMNTCKSPLGMFNESKIPNDFKLVADAIRNYETDDEETENGGKE